MTRRWLRFAVCGGWAFAAAGLVRADGPGARLVIDEATRGRCLAVLRAGLRSEQFWPALHAAEALSLSGHGEEVRTALAPKLAAETDDQRRCGIARELARAGDLARVSVLLDVLVKRDPHGHVHACESLFKIWQIGDGAALRAPLKRVDQPRVAIMAAAALARWGHREALGLLRKHVRDEDGATAGIAAWALARTGDRSDLPALRTGAQRFTDPPTRAYFEHALAALGDDEGLGALTRNLRHADPAVRVAAAEFATDARAVGARDALVHLLDDSELDVRVRAAEALLLLSRPAPPAPDEDVSRDVFVATPANPRYSEGSVLVLRDGRLLHATTEFVGSSSDFAAARLIAVESADGGRSWGSPHVVQENVGRHNVMSVTLRRLSGPERFDGPVGMFYLIKNSDTDLQVSLRVSDDEGATFGDPVRVTAEPGYHVMNNDRVTVLSTGRLVAPVATSADVKTKPFASTCYLSDDRGRTWRRSHSQVSYPKRGAMEPEVLELGDGRLLMPIRTQLGHIAISESKDGGETWGEARPWGVRAPEAPSTLRRIPSTGHLLLIWNDSYRAGEGHGGKRTPLTATVSTDEGRTWSYRRDVETSDRHAYAYTSVAFDRGRALLTYYVRDEATRRISSRFRSVPIAWFYETGGSR